MTPGEGPIQQSSVNTGHRVARLLRHEVGDLLQSIYATVALLLSRLPAESSLERRLLSELKTRAEVCRDEMDATVDLLSPLELSPARIDLAAAVGPALAQARRRHPNLPVQLNDDVRLTIDADGRILTGTLTFLLLAMCQGARQQVQVRVTREGDFACCSLERDGLALSDEHRAWLEQPFATTQQALLGLALASARRVVESGGGSVTATSRDGGGLCVRLLFPVMDV